MKRVYRLVKNLELKKSEQKYRELFEQSPEGIFIVNDKYEYVDVNESACKMSGFSKEELLNMNVFQLMDICNPEDLESMINNVKNGENAINEWKVRRKNGEEIFVETNVRLLSNGNLQGIVNNVTERKRMQMDLEESEKRNREILQFLPEAIYIREENKVTYCNNSAARMFGLNTPDEAIGKNIKDLMIPHDDFIDEYNIKMSCLGKDGYIPITRAKMISNSNQKVSYVEIEIRKVMFSGKEVYLCSAKDISELIKAEELQKELKAAKEYDKLKTEFFANLSHELRTPLNIILGILQLQDSLSKVGVEERATKMHGYFSVLKQNCYRLLRLVNNLLDITRIDAGYFEIRLRKCNIVSVVEDVTLLVIDYAKSKGIVLIFDTDVEEKYMVCDPEMIERIIMNLLSNAIKFTPNGGSIAVNMKDKGEGILISVKDTGIGIPMQKQKQIFERFVQVDRSLSKKYEGSGIGLSLVRSLVEMHGGVVNLVSEVDKGSEFIIELPCKYEDEQEYEIYGNDEWENHSGKVSIEFSDI